MLKDVVAVQYLDGYRLHVRFEDGVEGNVDLGPVLAFTGVFEPLRDPAEFARARVEPDLGTVCWPGGADIDPVVLYELVSSSAAPDLGSHRKTAAR